MQAAPQTPISTANEAQDRFGLISFGEELPDLGGIPELIGEEPAVAEEFDVEGADVGRGEGDARIRGAQRGRGQVKDQVVRPDHDNGSRDLLDRPQ